MKRVLREDATQKQTQGHQLPGGGYVAMVKVVQGKEQLRNLRGNAEKEMGKGNAGLQDSNSGEWQVP